MLIQKPLNIECMQEAEEGNEEGTQNTGGRYASEEGGMETEELQGRSWPRLLMSKQVPPQRPMI